MYENDNDDTGGDDFSMDPTIGLVKIKIKILNYIFGNIILEIIFI